MRSELQSAGELTSLMLSHDITWGRFHTISKEKKAIKETEF